MRIQDYVMALMVAVLWGGNFTAAKIAMEHFPPFYMAGLRFVLVAVLLIPFLRLKRERLKDYLILSVTLGSLHFALVFAGMYQGLDVTTSVLTTQMGVPFSCLLGTIFLHDRLGLWRSSGLMIAFTGLVMIMGAPRVLANLDGFFLVLAGAFFWSVSNIHIKKMGQVEIMPLLGWISLLSAPQLLLLSYFMEENHLELLMTIPLDAGLGVLYSVIFSTIIAYGLWYTLLARHPVSQVVPFSLMIPFFGVSAGMFMLGEELSLSILVGGVVCMIGVAIIVFRKPKIVAPVTTQ